MIKEPKTPKLKSFYNSLLRSVEAGMLSKKTADDIADAVYECVLEAARVGTQVNTWYTIKIIFFSFMVGFQFALLLKHFL